MHERRRERSSALLRYAVPQSPAPAGEEQQERDDAVSELDVLRPARQERAAQGEADTGNEFAPGTWAVNAPSTSTASPVRSRPRAPRHVFSDAAPIVAWAAPSRPLASPQHQHGKQRHRDGEVRDDHQLVPELELHGHRAEDRRREYERRAASPAARSTPPRPNACRATPAPARRSTAR